MDAKDVKKFKKLEMHLRPLFFLQEKLDEKIKGRYEYDPELLQEHYQKKVIGFRVEVAELLNAMKFHKYWRPDEAYSREEVLEEYADGLHLLLSIGIEKGIHDYQYKGFYDDDLKTEDLLYMFEKLLTIPWMDLRKDDYFLGLEMYLKLGELLVFSWDDIKTAYTEKNMRNQELQERYYRK